MHDALELPDFFREADDAAYTAEQLSPTLERLRLALNDVEQAASPAQGLILAWTRIAELRLPRKAVPTNVLRDVEALVDAWDAQGVGAISGYAYSLSEAELAQETARLQRMLSDCRAAATDAPAVARYRSE